jgi:alpha-mannosidase
MPVTTTPSPYDTYFQTIIVLLRTICLMPTVNRSKFTIAQKFIIKVLTEWPSFASQISGFTLSPTQQIQFDDAVATLENELVTLFGGNNILPTAAKQAACNLKAVLRSFNPNTTTTTTTVAP